VIVGVGRACPREIERHNIFQATALAMRRAIQTLGEDTLEPAKDEPLFAAPHENGKRDCLLVDGKPVKALPWRHEALVDGDARSLAIALASVVAKVTRDRLMRELAVAEPRYGFESHKGYGVPLHRERLREHGPCAEHRRSFLRGFLQNGESAARLAGQNLL
jgi:ribonuclease HII